MRSTIVPAQITTVEDRIAGRLGLSQLLLLTLPVFGGSALFVFLPPFFGYAAYKVVLIICFAAFCSLMSIRIKGRILLLWALAILRYNLRPQYYIFDKRSLHSRDITPMLQNDTEEDQEAEALVAHRMLPQLSPAEMVKAEAILSDPNANVRFEVGKKGELRVRLTEIQ